MFPAASTAIGTWLLVNIGSPGRANVLAQSTSGHAPTHPGRDPLERGRIETREERDRGQRLKDRTSYQHAADGKRVRIPTHPCNAAF